MKLSIKGQHAITAMMDLAIDYTASPVTLAEFSRSQTISLSYLEQLFSKLKKSGLVESVRGPGGGYRLSKIPNNISIADIIHAIEESTDSTKRHSNCKKGDNCETQHLWYEFSDQLTAFLDSITLADVIKDQAVIKNQYRLDETTRRISSMFPVSSDLMVA